MTEAELEEIRALGHLGMKPGACSGGEECRFRGAIDDLLSEVERLWEGLRAVLREHTMDNWPYALDHCRLCSPKESRWPCVTVRLARLPIFVLEEVRDACPKAHQRRALAQLITLRLVADRRPR